jgi:hypothetical protein
MLLFPFIFLKFKQLRIFHRVLVWRKIVLSEFPKTQGEIKQNRLGFSNMKIEIFLDNILANQF